MAGRTPTRSACFRIRSSSVYFSTTGMICRPIFLASITISMYSSSLNPLQMIGVVVVGHRHDGQQFRLRSGFQSETVWPAELEDLFDDLALLVHLDRVTRSDSSPLYPCSLMACWNAPCISPSRCFRISAKRIRIGR